MSKNLEAHTDVGTACVRIELTLKVLETLVIPLHQQAINYF